MARRDEPISRAVAAHYDAFPYPHVFSVSKTVPRTFERGHLEHLLGRRGACRLPAEPRIWVAGCGTRQSIQVALSFPEARIQATDLSSGPLEVARSIATDLGLSNITFRQQDLMAADHVAEFDLVYCTGVLHHLGDPAAGLGAIRRALAPGGAALILVYNRWHRLFNTAFQRALALFEQSTDPNTRFEVGTRLAAAALASEEVPFLRRHLARFDWKRNPAQFADTFAHPHEVSYGIDGLFSLIEGAGLRLTSWLHPSLWSLDHYIDDPDLLARWRQLAPREAAIVIHELAGPSGPAFECYVEPSDAPTPWSWSAEDLLDEHLVVRRRTIEHQIDRGRVVGRRSIPSWVEAGDSITFSSGGHPSVEQTWGVSKDMRWLLEALDGSRSLRGVLGGWDEVEQRSIATWLLELCRPSRALVAPITPP